MTSTIDQQFVEYIVKSLVGNPDAVKIDRRVDEKGVLLELTVDPEDLGRVIGKRGATAQSLRTLLRALGTKNEARYNLKIVDNGEPRPPRDYSSPASDGADDSSSDNSSTQDDQAVVVNDNAETAPSETVEAEEDYQNEEVVSEEKPAEESGDRFHRTRKELEDLDDLDI